MNNDRTVVIATIATMLSCFGGIAAAQDTCPSGYPLYCAASDVCCPYGDGGRTDVCCPGGLCTRDGNCGGGSTGGCDVGEYECGDYCVPSGRVCCSSIGRADISCPSGTTCRIDSSSPNGVSCGTGGGSTGGCDAGQYECGDYCVASGRVCCGSIGRDDISCPGGTTCRTDASSPTGVSCSTGGDTGPNPTCDPGQYQNVTTCPGDTCGCSDACTSGADCTSGCCSGGWCVPDCVCGGGGTVRSCGGGSPPPSSYDGGSGCSVNGVGAGRGSVFFVSLGLFGLAVRARRRKLALAVALTTLVALGGCAQPLTPVEARESSLREVPVERLVTPTSHLEEGPQPNERIELDVFTEPSSLPPLVEPVENRRITRAAARIGAAN